MNDARVEEDEWNLTHEWETLCGFCGLAPCECWMDAEDDELEQPPCGCQYCHCANTTIAGETCSECLVGSHQG